MIPRICRPAGAGFSFAMGFLQRCRAAGAGLQLWPGIERVAGSAVGVKYL
jgi:hypothetical protein